MKYSSQSLFVVATVTLAVLPVYGAPNINMDPTRIYFPDDLDEMRRAITIQQCQNNPRCRAFLSFAGIPNACSATGDVISNPVGVRASNRVCNPFEGEVIWPATGECVELLTQGPCPEGYWIKLNLNDLRPVCDRRVCGIGQALIKGRNCLPLKNQNGCPPGQFLVNNEYGIGECDCQPGKAYHHPTKACYSVYSQGPCPRGQIYKVLDGPGGSVAKCITNPCPAENMVILDSQCQINKNGSCYSLGTRGPCTSGILAIDRVLLEPLCVLETENHAIINVGPQNDCPVGELRDDAGVCRVSFRLSDTRRCHRGSIRDQIGRCRKTFIPVSAEGGTPCPNGMIMLGGACYKLAG